MATVQGLTKTRMLSIEANSIVDGNVVGSNLILVKQNGNTIDAGNVKGPPGNTGSPGWAAIQEIGTANLDGYVSPGAYHQNSDASAAAGSNYPTPYAGILTVLANSTNQRVYQTYHVSYNGPYAGEFFTRLRSNVTGLWTPWLYMGRKLGGWTSLTLGDGNLVALGGSYQTPQYKIEDRAVYLRGVLKTLTARTAQFTIATLAASPPAADEIFLQPAGQTWTSSGSSAVNTGAASTGTAHTHPIPHTHTVAQNASRIDVSSAGVISMTPTATNPLPIDGFISLSKMSWDLA